MPNTQTKHLRRARTKTTCCHILHVIVVASSGLLPLPLPTKPPTNAKTRQVAEIPLAKSTRNSYRCRDDFTAPSTFLSLFFTYLFTFICGRSLSTLFYALRLRSSRPSRDESNCSQMEWRMPECQSQCLQ